MHCQGVRALPDFGILRRVGRARFDISSITLRQTRIQPYMDDCLGSEEPGANRPILLKNSVPEQGRHVTRQPEADLFDPQ